MEMHVTIKKKRTEEESTRTTGAVVGGALLGASVGGPVGAILGGIAGAILGESVNESNRNTVRTKRTGVKDTAVGKDGRARG